MFTRITCQNMKVHIPLLLLQIGCALGSSCDAGSYDDSRVETPSLCEAPKFFWDCPCYCHYGYGESPLQVSESESYGPRTTKYTENFWNQSPHYRSKFSANNEEREDLTFNVIGDNTKMLHNIMNEVRRIPGDLMVKFCKNGDTDNLGEIKTDYWSLLRCLGHNYYFFSEPTQGSQIMVRSGGNTNNHAMDKVSNEFATFVNGDNGKVENEYDKNVYDSGTPINRCSIGSNVNEAQAVNNDDRNNGLRNFYADFKFGDDQGINTIKGLQDSSRNVKFGEGFCNGNMELSNKKSSINHLNPKLNSNEQMRYSAQSTDNNIALAKHKHDEPEPNEPETEVHYVNIPSWDIITGDSNEVTLPSVFSLPTTLPLAQSFYSQGTTGFDTNTDTSPYEQSSESHMTPITKNSYLLTSIQQSSEPMAESSSLQMPTSQSYLPKARSSLPTYIPNLKMPKSRMMPSLTPWSTLQTQRFQHMKQPPIVEFSQSMARSPNSLRIEPMTQSYDLQTSSTHTPSLQLTSNIFEPMTPCSSLQTPLPKTSETIAESLSLEMPASQSTHMAPNSYLYKPISQNSEPSSFSQTAFPQIFEPMERSPNVGPINPRLDDVSYLKSSLRYQASEPSAVQYGHVCPVNPKPGYVCPLNLIPDPFTSLIPCRSHVKPLTIGTELVNPNYARSSQSGLVASDVGPAFSKECYVYPVSLRSQAIRSGTTNFKSYPDNIVSCDVCPANPEPGFVCPLSGIGPNNLLESSRSYFDLAFSVPDIAFKPVKDLVPRLLTEGELTLLLNNNKHLPSTQFAQKSFSSPLSSLEQSLSQFTTPDPLHSSSFSYQKLPVPPNDLVYPGPYNFDSHDIMYSSTPLASLITQSTAMPDATMLPQYTTIPGTKTPSQFPNILEDSTTSEYSIIPETRTPSQLPIIPDSSMQCLFPTTLYACTQSNVPSNLDSSLIPIRQSARTSSQYQTVPDASTQSQYTIFLDAMMPSQFPKVLKCKETQFLEIPDCSTWSQYPTIPDTRTQSNFPIIPDSSLLPIIQSTGTPSQNPTILDASTQSQYPTILDASTPSLYPTILDTSTQYQFPTPLVPGTPSQFPTILDASTLYQYPTLPNTDMPSQFQALPDIDSPYLFPTISDARTSSKFPIVPCDTQSQCSATSNVNTPHVPDASTQPQIPAIVDASSLYKDSGIPYASTLSQFSTISNASTQFSATFKVSTPSLFPTVPNDTTLSEFQKNSDGTTLPKKAIASIPSQFITNPDATSILQPQFLTTPDVGVQTNFLPTIGASMQSQDDKSPSHFPKTPDQMDGSWPSQFQIDSRAPSQFPILPEDRTLDQYPLMPDGGTSAQFSSDERTPSQFPITPEDNAPCPYPLMPDGGLPAQSPPDERTPSQFPITPEVSASSQYPLMPDGDTPAQFSSDERTPSQFPITPEESVSSKHLQMPRWPDGSMATQLLTMPDGSVPSELSTILDGSMPSQFPTMSDGSMARQFSTMPTQFSKMRYDSMPTQFPTMPDGSMPSGFQTMPDGSLPSEFPTMPDGSMPSEFLTMPDGSVPKEFPTMPDDSMASQFPIMPDAGMPTPFPTMPCGSMPDGSIPSQFPKIRCVSMTTQFPIMPDASMPTQFPNMPDGGISTPFPTMPYGSMPSEFLTLPDGSMPSQFPTMPDGSIPSQFPKMPDGSMARLFPTMPDESITIPDGSSPSQFPKIRYSSMPTQFPTMPDGSMARLFPTMPDESITIPDGSSPSQFKKIRYSSMPTQFPTMPDGSMPSEFPASPDSRTPTQFPTLPDGSVPTLSPTMPGGKTPYRLPTMPDVNTPSQFQTMTYRSSPSPLPTMPYGITPSQFYPDSKPYKFPSLPGRTVSHFHTIPDSSMLSQSPTMPDISTPSQFPTTMTGSLVTPKFMAMAQTGDLSTFTTMPNEDNNLIRLQYLNTVDKSLPDVFPRANQPHERFYFDSTEGFTSLPKNTDIMHPQSNFGYSKRLSLLPVQYPAASPDLRRNPLLVFDTSHGPRLNSKSSKVCSPLSSSQPSVNSMLDLGMPQICSNAGVDLVPYSTASDPYSSASISPLYESQDSDFGVESTLMSNFQQTFVPNYNTYLDTIPRASCNIGATPTLPENNKSKLISTMPSNPFYTSQPNIYSEHILTTRPSMIVSNPMWSEFPLSASTPSESTYDPNSSSSKSLLNPKVLFDTAAFDSMSKPVITLTSGSLLPTNSPIIVSNILNTIDSLSCKSDLQKNLYDSNAIDTQPGVTMQNIDESDDSTNFNSIPVVNSEVNSLDNILKDLPCKLKCDVENYVNNKLQIIKNELLNTNTYTANLNNICYAKYTPNTGVVYRTDNPKIWLKMWHSKNKILKCKLIFQTEDLKTLNFIPIVDPKYIPYFKSPEVVQDIANKYITKYFTQPYVVKGVYSTEQPYAELNLGNIAKNRNFGNAEAFSVLWPTFCSCGCGKSGCRCQWKQ